MYKSLISRNNEVVFYGGLWIMWSLTWIVILIFTYSLNDTYSLGDFFTGNMLNNNKYFWITIIWLVAFVVSIISLIMLTVKVIDLHKNTKIYNLNDGVLIFVYYITTVFFYCGVFFFILYKSRLASVRTRTNMYESKKLDNYIGDRAKNAQLTDNRVITISGQGQQPVQRQRKVTNQNVQTRQQQRPVSGNAQRGRL